MNLGFFWCAIGFIGGLLWYFGFEISKRRIPSPDDPEWVVRFREHEKQRRISRINKQNRI